LIKFYEIFSGTRVRGAQSQNIHGIMQAGSRASGALASARACWPGGCNAQKMINFAA
jgi:hypothetical protein